MKSLVEFLTHPFCTAIALSVLVAAFSIVILDSLLYQAAPQTPTKPYQAPVSVAVTDSDGKQTLIIYAKGGYSPRRLMAKADTPTTLKVVTEGTYDCSSALRIPALDYSVHLPSTGETTIDVPPQKSGTVLTGLCSMGMYSFKIAFE